MEENLKKNLTLTESEPFFSRKIYDFDEFSLFLLNLLLNLDNLSFIRWSSSGEALHVETNLDLRKFQDQNRQRWSELYGYTITFNKKRSLKSKIIKKVDTWQPIHSFIKSNVHILSSYCVSNHAKKINEKTRRRKSTIKKPSSFQKS